MDFFFLGDSHLGSVVRCYQRRVQAGTTPQLPHFIWLSLQEFRPHIAQGGSAQDVLNDNLRTAVLTHAAKSPLLVMSIAGNHHNVLGLLNDPEPFDFVLPSRPDLPMADGHRVLPVAIVRQALLQMLDQPLRLLRLVARTTPVRKVHLQSPPPNPSADHIASNPDDVFKKKIGELGVSPKALRFKLWLLHSELYAQVCREEGVAYIAPPAEALDAEGFLKPEAWGKDATHAGDWYGERIVEQVERLATATAR